MLSSERPAFSGERYDLGDFINPAVLQAVSGQRYDAASTAMFLRDLTYVYEQTYDIKYPDLKARQILPVDNRVSPGAESFLWRQYDGTGTAKIIDSYSEDLGNSEVIAAEYQSRCLSMGTSYQYTLQDMRAASMAGLPLETRKAERARRNIEKTIEQVAFFGVQQVSGMANQGIAFAPPTVNTSDPLAMYGLTNFPGIIVNNTTVNWTLGGTTVTQILNDFNVLQRSIVTTSLGVHVPDTAVFPLSTWALLTTVARSPTYTDDSILQYLQKQSPWLKTVFFTPMLETAGLKQDGTTPGPRIMLLERKPENLQLVIPQEFEQLPPQMINLSFKVPCHARIGGVRVSYPKSIACLDGTAG